MIVHSSPVRGGWRKVKIERHLDHTAAPAVLDEIIRAAGAGGTNLLIDLDAVDAADSHGIAALAAAVRHIRRTRNGVRIAVLAHRTELADAVALALRADEALVIRDPAALSCGNVVATAA